MRELLGMCGYEEREIDTELPRIQAAFAAVGIDETDMGEAKRRLRTYYDLDLAGIRKIFRMLIDDLANVVFMREDGRQKIVYSFMAPGTEPIGSAIMMNSTGVGLINPGWTYLVVLGCIFDKLARVFEAAEKLWLKPGIVAHCGNVKMGLGLFALDLIPKPDLIVTAGLLCDTSSKTHDLIEEFYGIPAAYYDCWQDREWREYPKAKRATSYTAKSLRRLAQDIYRHTGFEIADAMVWDALEIRNTYQTARNRVVGLIRESDPLPLASAHLNLLFALDAIPLREHEAARAVEAFDILHEELLERKREGIGVTPKGAPRVLAILPNHHSNPEWEHLPNQMGLAIVGSDPEFTSSEADEKAALADPNDPYDAIAQMMHGSLMQILGGRIEIIADACRRLNIDGLLNHYHVGCRYVAGDAIMIKNEISARLGIPVLTIEFDNFDPRVYDEEQYRAELEVFKEMMEAAKDS